MPLYAAIIVLLPIEPCFCIWWSFIVRKVVRSDTDTKKKNGKCAVDYHRIMCAKIFCVQLYEHLCLRNIQPFNYLLDCFLNYGIAITNITS